MTVMAAAACGTHSEATPAATRSSAEPGILVAYFSRSGNTRVIAGLLQRAFSADVFEIQPATPYPEEYLATVARATRERDRGTEPAITAKIPGIARYAMVLLGFPIWGETTPPVIRSFLKAHDLAGKTVVPFVTHGGYGLGGSQAVLASHAVKAKLLAPFSMQADQERQTMNTVNEWTKKLRVTTPAEL